MEARVGGTGSASADAALAAVADSRDQRSISALLSHVLVAFTIELDNEFEHRMPHRTTDHGSTLGRTGGPWLVSMAMWANCMAFVPDDGITVRELERTARTRTNLDGMRRWGYVVLSRPGSIAAPSGPPRPDWLVRPTANGRQAQNVWRPLFDEIEGRWRVRFGGGEIDAVRRLLEAIDARIDPDLPDCLPILGYGLFTGGRQPGRAHRAVRPAAPAPAAPSASGEPDVARSDVTAPRAAGPRASGPGAGPRPSGPGAAGPRAAERYRPGLPLSSLLARVLLAFAIEFEAESHLSLAISANVMRALGADGVRVRDLPDLTGISAEAVAVTNAFLEKSGHAVAESLPPPSRGKAVRLTATGRAAQASDRALLEAIDERWRARFEDDVIGGLQASLERLVGEPGSEPSPLVRGLQPYPDGWRAAVRQPGVLPDYPMVLHRGGFPDGS